MADAPFYRFEQQGGQLVLFLNKGHHSYTDVYNLVEGAEGFRVRALELLFRPRPVRTGRPERRPSLVPK